MIFNLIKNLIMALLLDAGAALAFDVEGAATVAPAAATAAAPQSCALPFAAATDSAEPQVTQLDDTGAHS